MDNEMIQLKNKTDFSACIIAAPISEKNIKQVCVVKESFFFDEHGEIRTGKPQSKIQLYDQHEEGNPNSSLLAAEDIVPYKSKAEIFIQGSVPAQPNISDQLLIAKISNKKNIILEKQVHIFGERKWYFGLTGYRISKPKNLKTTKLIFENAFGGQHPKKIKRVFLQNPIGLGYAYRHAFGTSPFLPCLENPKQYLKALKDKPNPACFAPLPRWFEPRLSCFINQQPEKYQQALVDQQFFLDNSPEIKIELNNFFDVNQNTKIRMENKIIKAFLSNQVEIDFSGVVRETLSLKPDTFLVNIDKKQISIIYRVGISQAQIDQYRYLHLLK